MYSTARLLTKLQRYPEQLIESLLKVACFGAGLWHCSHCSGTMILTAYLILSINDLSREITKTVGPGLSTV